MIIDIPTFHVDPHLLDGFGHLTINPLGYLKSCCYLFLMPVVCVTSLLLCVWTSFIARYMLSALP